jgi:hypothetical protein
VLLEYRSIELFRLTQISLKLQRDRLVEGDFWGEVDMSRSSAVNHISDALHLVPGKLALADSRLSKRAEPPIISN